MVQPSRAFPITLFGRQLDHSQTLDYPEREVMRLLKNRSRYIQFCSPIVLEDFDTPKRVIFSDETPHERESHGILRESAANGSQSLEGHDASPSYDAIYRRASCRCSLALVFGAAGAAQPLPFFSCIQAIVRHAAAPIFDQPTNRTGQTLAGGAQAVGDRDWI